MTHDEAIELADLAIEAKKDAYTYGGFAILNPSTEAYRLISYVISARRQLRGDGWYLIAKSF